jgi:hypothetical protein
MAYAGARSWTSHGPVAAVVGGSWDKMEGTAGDRRWSTVTALLGDAPSALEDALALFRAGEPLDVVAEQYGIPRAQLEDAVRIATRVAA